MVPNKMIRCRPRVKTYRIEGGVPAGIRMPPGDAGWRTNRRSIKTITRHGNSNTNPRGIEMEELPFKRMRRRKKAKRWDPWPFSWEASSIGRLGALGSRLAMRWMKLMNAVLARVEDPTVARSIGPGVVGSENRGGPQLRGERLEGLLASSMGNRETFEWGVKYDQFGTLQSTKLRYDPISDLREKKKKRVAGGMPPFLFFSLNSFFSYPSNPQLSFSRPQNG